MHRHCHPSTAGTSRGRLRPFQQQQSGNMLWVHSTESWSEEAESKTHTPGVTICSVSTQMWQIQDLRFVFPATRPWRDKHTSGRTDTLIPTWNISHVTSSDWWTDAATTNYPSFFIYLREENIKKQIICQRRPFTTRHTQTDTNWHFLQGDKQLHVLI